MIIYKATNKINGKCYIGQTVRTLKERKRGHINSLKTPFHKAIKKYGKKNFEWEVLQNCNTIIELNEMEILYQKMYNSIYPNGYNMLYGDSGATHKDTRKRLSDKMIGNTNGKKAYKIITPQGDTIIIENLKQYCKDNKLNYNTMIGVANKRKHHNHHKGFVCCHIEDDPDNAIINRNTSGYILTDPNGNDITIYDLKNFCKQIPNLNRYGFIRILKGKTKKDNYKGWKIRRIKQ